MASGATSWVAGERGTTKVNASTGFEEGWFTDLPVLANPLGVAFDGTNIRVTNSGSNSLSRIVPF